MLKNLGMENGNQFLDIGTCLLRNVHSSFKKASKVLDFGIDLFAVDIHSFLLLTYTPYWNDAFWLYVELKNLHNWKATIVLMSIREKLEMSRKQMANSNTKVRYQMLSPSYGHSSPERFSINNNILLVHSSSPGENCITTLCMVKH